MGKKFLCQSGCSVPTLPRARQSSSTKSPEEEPGQERGPFRECWVSSPLPQMGPSSSELINGRKNLLPHSHECTECSDQTLTSVAQSSGIGPFSKILGFFLSLCLIIIVKGLHITVLFSVTMRIKLFFAVP